jgi:hypothetical protein
MTRTLSLKLLAVAALALSGLTACEKSVEAPDDTGVCWQMVEEGKGKVHFNVVAKNVPNLERCAANLEALRLKFLAIGGNKSELTGAYQGQFIFVQREGIFVGQSLTSGRYPALVRTGDGRLAVPGAMPQ